jgi:hypothetical protein
MAPSEKDASCNLKTRAVGDFGARTWAGLAPGIGVSRKEVQTSFPVRSANEKPTSHSLFLGNSERL